MIIEVERPSPSGLCKVVFTFDVTADITKFNVRLGSYRIWVRPSKRHRNYACKTWWDRFRINPPGGEQLDARPDVPADVTAEVVRKLAERFVYHF